MIVDPEDPLAIAVTQAIRTGDLEGLRRLLEANPGLATARLGHDRPGGETRSLLHVATDWPGHFPNGAATVALLLEAGAHANAALPTGETPLMTAARTGSVIVLSPWVRAGVLRVTSGAASRRPRARRSRDTSGMK